MKNKRKIANNCEKATFLIEKKQLGKISFMDKIELQIHLAGCFECRVYKKQSKIISEATRKILNSAVQENLHLDENFKKALQQLINTRL